jgi:hypothetical protein
MTEGIELYQQYRDRIRTGDLVEWKSFKPIGYAIRSITKENVNHTSGAIWMHSVENAFHGVSDPEMRLYVGEAIANGFRSTFLSKEISTFDGEVYWVPLKPEYDHKRLEIIRNVHALEGRPYDYKSLIQNLWRRVPLDATKPYCSEAWHIALVKSGLLESDFSPTGKPKDKRCGLRPGEFYKTGLFLNPIRIY